MLYHLFSKAVLLGLSTIFLRVVLSTNAVAETIYHLHKEASATSGLNQLKTAGPDATTVALTSFDLKDLATGTSTGSSALTTTLNSFEQPGRFHINSWSRLRKR